MLFLKQQGLLKFGKDRFILLTEKGFAVALENEKSLLNFRVTNGMLSFSVLLFLVTLANIIINMNGSFMSYYVVVVFMIVFGVFGYLNIKLELR